MTFLTPWAGIAAAALAGPVLVALYLLKLRRRPMRVSSTLLWTSAVRDLEANVPLKWLKPTWLLLLQLMILALFATALARPAMNMAEASAARTFIVIDRSASMSASDEPGAPTRLELAKARAIELVDRLDESGGRSAMVLSVAAEARALTNLTTDLGLVRGAIAAITPSDQPADVPAALELIDAVAAGLASESTQGVELSEVVLFSDGAIDRGDGLSVTAGSVRFERVGPMDGATPDNLGIVALAARRDYQDPATVRLFVRVQNAGSGAVAAPIAVTLDGAVIKRTALDVPARGASGGGQAAATIEVQTSAGGVLEAVIERPDALASDNRGAVVVRQAARPAVVIVAPDAETQDAAPTGTVWIIGDVLSEMQLRSVRTIGISRYQRAVMNGDGIDADVLVFDRVRPEPLPTTPALLFAAAEDAPDQSGGYVLSWQRSHPLMRGVGLDGVYIARAAPITPAGGEELVELARGPDGPLIALATLGAARRVYVGFDAAQSTWPVQVSFPVFLANTVEFLAGFGEGESAGSVRTTEAVEVDVAPGGGARRVVVEPPAGLGLGPMTVALNERTAGPISIGVLERAGVYRVMEPAVDQPMIAVNVLDAQESLLDAPQSVVIAGGAVSGAGADAAPRELWQWFVLAAAMLLLLEWMLYARQVRV